MPSRSNRKFCLYLGDVKPLFVLRLTSSAPSASAYVTFPARITHLCLDFPYILFFSGHSLGWAQRDSEITRRCIAFEISRLLRVYTDDKLNRFHSAPSYNSQAKIAASCKNICHLFVIYELGSDLNFSICCRIAANFITKSTKYADMSKNLIYKDRVRKRERERNSKKY